MVRKGFGLPEGTVGRLGGWLMARGNGPTEKHLVKLAGLQPKEFVVVLGPGPGVGLRAAAKYGGIVVGVDPHSRPTRRRRSTGARASSSAS